MDLLLDTHVLAWIAHADDRIGPAMADALHDGQSRFVVSAVTAWEFANLARRGRFGDQLSLQALVDRLDARIVSYPAEAWRLAETLPDIHRDSVDRMLIAHAIHADLTLVTADATMRRYPVRTLW